MFPPPVKPHIDLEDRRSKRLSQVRYAGLIGAGIRLLIVMMELTGYYYFDSHSLLYDGLSTLFDVLTTFGLLFCIQLAQRPPDSDHPFGHGRYEPVAGMQAALTLGFLGFYLLIQEASNFFEGPKEKTALPLAALGIALCATVLLELAYRYLRACAKKENSPALLSEAMHYRVDAFTSLLASLALLVGQFFPQLSHPLDKLGALMIALTMIGLGFYAARENFHQLTDRSPDDKYFEKVREAAMSVEGVLETEKLLIQRYGPDAHVNLDIEVNPSISVEVAHRISQNVRATIQSAWPQVRDVTVHIEPYYENDH